MNDKLGKMIKDMKEMTDNVEKKVDEFEEEVFTTVLSKGFDAADVARKYRALVNDGRDLDEIIEEGDAHYAYD